MQEHMEENVPLEQIDLSDESLLARTSLDRGAIEQYRQCDPGELQRKDDPIILVKGSAGRFIIVSGHHRLLAMQKRKVHSVDAQVYDELPRTDALVLALTSNLRHGVRLRPADKRHVCKQYWIALDAEEQYPTDKVVADTLGVSPQVAKSCREELENEGMIQRQEARTDAAGHQRKTKPRTSEPAAEAAKRQLRAVNETLSGLQEKKAELTLDEAAREGLRSELTKLLDRIQQRVENLFEGDPPGGEMEVELE